MYNSEQPKGNKIQTSSKKFEFVGQITGVTII